MTSSCASCLGGVTGQLPVNRKGTALRENRVKPPLEGMGVTYPDERAPSCMAQARESVGGSGKGRPGHVPTSPSIR
jgi:hypothetical protein